MRSALPIAVRVYPDLPSSRTDREVTPPIDAMLVFDCETRTDKAQALTFGSYRLFAHGRCIEEGLFYGDDLLPREKRMLERYVASHAAETDPRGIPEQGVPADPTLHLLSLAQFRDKLYRVGFKGRALLVAFNFPFDASRLALNYTRSRGRFLGGFSFTFFQHRDAAGVMRPSRYRPTLTVKHVDNKRSFERFTAPIDRDKEDRIPEDGRLKPDDRFKFRGYMLDAKTLAFALTDQNLSLETACELFGVTHGKHKVKRHGIITSKYIDYNRRDVLATYELTEKLLAEYALHPIPLQVTKAYSAASIGKAYLEAMGITPLLARMPEYPKRYLGYAQSAFYGGRASAHVRKVPVPVVYTDFLSQYSTVNVLMGLWNFVTASDIRVIEDAREDLAAILREVTPEWLLEQGNWKRLAGFARVIPDGDVLPLRAKYGGNDWQIGVNYAYASGDDPDDALWYSWPDLAASALLSGKQPRIIEAFKIEPVGKAETLKPVEFRGQVRIDPRTQDFFKTVIEERNRLAARTDLEKSERDRLKRSLKTLGSATSYGIFAQMDRKESPRKVTLTCCGIDPEPYECTVKHPESPGEFCFPPLASLITGGSHLLLALLERLVTDRGGTYAMEDTDSMAIVASEDGGLVACPGGPYQTEDGREAIRALTWVQVREIVALLDHLNPYDRDAVKGTILKVEGDNFDPKTEQQRQLWCVAISAKRYALLLRDRNGEPELLRKGVNNGDNEDGWSLHGLGHLLNPTDPESSDQAWIAHAWLAIVRRSLGLKAEPLPFEKVVAVGQTTVSSPEVLKPLAAFNAGKPYAQQIKPFNFILSCHVAPYGYPVGADPERFHLIAPYERDARKWLQLPWIDQYSKQRYRISTSVPSGTRFLARVQSYGDVLEDYEFHEEAKCSGASGAPCSAQSIGLLGRRHVRIEEMRFIGKESNKLEEAEERRASDAADVYTEYPNARRDEWVTKVLPIIRAMSVATLMALSNLTRRTIQRIRAGQRPTLNHQRDLMRLAKAELKVGRQRPG